MASPIGATPVLSGKAAQDWWDTVEREKNQKFSPIPTPKLENLRKEILANAKNKRKK
jgi:hypothetical protein